MSNSSFQQETSKKLFEKKGRHGKILGDNADKLGDVIDKMLWRHRDTTRFAETAVALSIWLLSKFYTADNGVLLHRTYIFNGAVALRNNGQLFRCDLQDSRVTTTICTSLEVSTSHTYFIVKQRKQRTCCKRTGTSVNLIHGRLLAKIHSFSQRPCHQTDESCHTHYSV